MNHQFKALLLLLWAIFTQCVASESASIVLRGSKAANDPTANDLHQEPQDRRRLLQGITCRLYFQDIDFQGGYSEERWVCRLSQDDSRNVDGLQFVQLVEADRIVANAISGTSTLTTSEAIIDVEDATMVVPSNALYALGSDGEENQRRNLAVATRGTLSTLVIRITDKDETGPTSSASQLRSDIFEDAVSPRSQFRDCSYGQLILQPFSGYTDTGRQVSNGIIEIQVPVVASESKEINFQNKAFNAAKEQIGDLESDKYDLVLFVFPPGTGNWLAYAFANSKFSFYNDNWSKYVSVVMHELGHNMGLAHSGEIGRSSYDDQQGIMGFAQKVDDQRICFNPAKNFQLGWYDDQVLTINPLKQSSGPVGTYRLNGVADYKRDQESLIVLRLDGSEKDYYIGFNRDVGINEDTIESKNTVTIVQKDNAPYAYGESTKLASINLGFSHYISKFNGDRDVEIRYVAGLDNRFALIEVRDVKQAANAGPAVPCKSFVIELETDQYPEDNYWTIQEDGGIGRVYARSYVFTEKERFYRQQICLPYNKRYKFVITDVYGDGMCCKQGRGYYKVKDDRDNTIFSGGDEFTVNSEIFSVGSSSGDVPLRADDDCKDQSGKFQWKRKRNSRKILSRKKDCAFIGRNNKCNSVDINGTPMSEFCKASCGQCD